jgi:hypothetical protein
MPEDEPTEEQLLDEPLGNRTPTEIAVDCCRIIFARQTAIEEQIAELVRRLEELGALCERQQKALQESVDTMREVLMPRFRGNAAAN